MRILFCYYEVSPRGSPDPVYFGSGVVAVPQIDASLHDQLCEELWRKAPPLGERENFAVVIKQMNVLV